MKRILLATLAFGCAGAIALAQGTVNFQSASTSAVVEYYYYHPVQPASAPVGQGFSAALYGGVLGASEWQMSQLGGPVPVTAGSGLIIGGGTRTNAFVAGGAPATFQVRAWYGPYASYEQALFGEFAYRTGKTAVFTNPTGNPGAIPPGLPAFLTGWNSPLFIYVPEPSGLTLLGLTSLIFFAFRAKRRKQSWLPSVLSGGPSFSKRPLPYH